MSNTINASIQLQVSLSGGGSISGIGSQQLTQSGSHNIENVQNIGTVAETITLVDLASVGFILIKNLDATNYVEIDSANTFDKFPQKILPGGSILLSPETTTIYAKAHTAACDCLIVASEL